MKSSASRFLQICPFLMVPFLVGCSETEGQIAALKDRIEATRQSTQATSAEFQEMTQKLNLLKRQISSDAAKRTEFEAKSTKSTATQEMLIKYRTDLEKGLTEFSAAVASYREKYAAP